MTTASPFSDPPRPLFADGGAGDVSADSGEGGHGALAAGSATLDGRLAVVTGAGGPLGAAIAAALASRGAAVCLLGRDRAALSASRSMMPAGSRAPMLVCDLVENDDIEVAAAFVARLGRPVGVVVHAAGIQVPSTVSDAPVETLDEHYLLNVRGPYLLTQRILPLMERGRGRLVFFGVSAGTSTADAHFAITRAAVTAMAAELRREVAGAELGVIEVETSEGPRNRPDGSDQDAFLEALAETVADAVVRSPIDVTELRVTHPSAGERREER